MCFIEGRHQRNSLKDTLYNKRNFTTDLFWCLNWQVMTSVANFRIASRHNQKVVHFIYLPKGKLHDSFAWRAGICFKIVGKCHTDATKLDISSYMLSFICYLFILRCLTFYFLFLFIYLFIFFFWKWSNSLSGTDSVERVESQVILLSFRMIPSVQCRP